MDMYVMNGTNQVVPMNGGEYVKMYEWPIQGTNQVVPMQGTNQVVPMQGTNQVVPLQGLNGGMYEVEMLPLALLDESDVPMQGLPDDYTDEDIEIYRLAYLSGDPDAMQGLFKNLRDKVKGATSANRQARTDRREDRSERKELRQQARAVRREKAARGEGFLDRVGGFVQNIGEAKRIAAEAGAALDAAGIDYDDEVLEQRAAIAADAGATSGDVRMTRGVDTGANAGGLMAWWNARSTNEKILYGAGAAVGLYVGYKLLTGQPIMGGKKRGKK